MSENDRQFVKYTFYKVDRGWRLLPAEEKRRGKEQFLAILDEFAGQLMLRTYSTVDPWRCRFPDLERL